MLLPTTFIVTAFLLASGASAHAAPKRGATATAQLAAKSGTEVRGTVAFAETKGGLRVRYELQGFKANQVSGFHIHEMGDCSSADAKSAGGHFMPMRASGGTSIEFPQKHAGDLPAIRADAEGQARGEIVVPSLTLRAGERSVRGRAIVVHGGPDDVTQAAAPRVACGVIRAPGGT